MNEAKLILTGFSRAMNTDDEILGIPRCEAMVVSGGFVEQCDMAATIACRDGKFLCPADAVLRSMFTRFNEATGLYEEAV